MSIRSKRIVVATAGGILPFGDQAAPGALTGCGSHRNEGGHKGDPVAVAERHSRLVEMAGNLRRLNTAQEKNSSGAQAFISDKASAFQGNTSDVAAAADCLVGSNPAKHQQVRDPMTRRRGWGG
jgi:hypothetical protein